MRACVLVVWQDTEIIEAPVNLSTLATRYASAASDFIAEAASKGQPFFLYFPFSHIHHLCSPGAPLGDKQWAGPGFYHKGTAGGVADAVEEMDWIAGEVLRSLREAGVEESYVTTPTTLRSHRDSSTSSHVSSSGISTGNDSVGDAEGHRSTRL